MKEETKGNTRLSGVETDIRGVQKSIGGSSTLAVRQNMCRPLNEDNSRGIRTDAEIRGSGEWVIA